MQLLLENGADINSSNAIGQTVLQYCFARLDEETSVFENKNLCIKMAELLLRHGANVNTIVDEKDGTTMLMQFCGITEELSEIQADVNLEIIQFLIEHGADINMKNKKGETAWDLSKNSFQRTEIQSLLKSIKQKYFHKNVKPIPILPLQEFYGVVTGKGEVNIEKSGIKCECFSCYKCVL